jgi:membrane protein involved in colicin uptake
MNRSILIVICDFLLISLLAFSSVDINKVGEEGVARTATIEVKTNQVDSGSDLANVMQLALTDERKQREQLLGELTHARGALTEREQQTQSLQQRLQTREQESERLQQQQRELQQQFATAETNVQALRQQLQSSSTEAVMTKEQLAAMEAEARKRAEQASALQEQLAQLAKSNQVVLNEKQELTGRLQVAEVEKRHATEQVTRMTEQVKVEREEKAKLAEGVKALASRSGELVQEIRENRPLAPNTIFNDFLTNRVQARLVASRSGLFGNEASRREQTHTILVTDGSNYVALCHVQDTPLTLWNPGTQWEGLTGALNRNLAQVPVRSLSFAWPDPRVVWMPVTAAEARQLGGKVYQTSADPFKFQDAVLVGAQEGYYGECRFQIDPAMPDYVQLDRSVLKGLFGKFNPSRGDLVFSRTGELLGIMVNSTYCMMIRKFDATATFQFGPDVRAQRTGEVLAQLHSQITQLPLKLQ